MGITKKGFGVMEDDAEGYHQNEEISDDDDDSDDDSVDSDVSSILTASDSDSVANAEPSTSQGTANVEDEEDEVIKAIRRECEKERDHPPIIHCDDYIVDISFHPHEDLLGVALITGDVLLYDYSNDANTLVKTLELHTKACRDIEFSHDGKVLFSTSKDKTIMLTDLETGKLQKFYEKAHDEPIYCLSVLDENMFATGDDKGVIKLWDLRTSNQDKAIFQIMKNEDYISDIITNESKKYLLCSSGDGSLTTIDLQQRKFLMQSEEYVEELTCLGLFRTETKLLAGTSKGKLFLYNWHEFGLHSDEFPGPKTHINSLVPITENIVVTACDDGNLRATHLFPHRHLGVVGQHELNVENVDISNNGKFIASNGIDGDIKFWNIQYFEDFEKVSVKHNKHNKRKDLDNNLPSSKRQNVADFFSDLS